MSKRQRYGDEWTGVPLIVGAIWLGVLVAGVGLLAYMIFSEVVVYWIGAFF